MGDRTPLAEGEPKKRTGLANFLNRLWTEKPLGTFSGIIILLLIMVAVFAHVLAPYGYSEPHLADRLAGPSAQYLLGTDQLGRDFLSRLIYGARISLLVGLAATAINVVVSLLIGGTSGFLGGKLDLVVQRFVDAWMAFPGLLLLLTIMSIAGRGLVQIMISSLFELAPRAVSWRSWSASPGPGRIDWIELNRVACGWIYGIGFPVWGGGEVGGVVGQAGRQEQCAGVGWICRARRRRGAV